MNPRQVVSFVLHLYWRLFRPKSFGVKAIIMHPDNPDLCLVVQHNYGNQFAWNLPGGGYQPAHESPEQAIIRELREELGVVATVKLRLDDYYTDAQGKRDTVSLFICTTDTLAFSLNHEGGKCPKRLAGALCPFTGITDKFHDLLANRDDARRFSRGHLGGRGGFGLGRCWHGTYLLLTRPNETAVGPLMGFAVA